MDIVYNPFMGAYGEFNKFRAQSPSVKKRPLWFLVTWESQMHKIFIMETRQQHHPFIHDKIQDAVQTCGTFKVNTTTSRLVKQTSERGWRASDGSRTYIHLPCGHEVCTLPHPLKDLLQLGADEGVVWREKDTVRKIQWGHLKSLLPWSAYLGCWASGLSWVQLHGPYTECWRYARHWPLTGRESRAGRSCLQTHRSSISNDIRRSILEVPQHDRSRLFHLICCM